MEALPQELMALVSLHATPRRRGALLQTSRAVQRSLCQVMETCHLELADTEDELPPLPPPCRYPRVQTVRVCCGWQQLGKILGPPGFVKLAGPGATAVTTGRRLAGSYFATCTLLNAASAIFSLANQADAVAACALVARCPGLRTVRFHTLGRAVATLPALSSGVEGLEVQNVGCPRLCLPALRRLNILDLDGHVVVGGNGSLAALREVTVTAGLVTAPAPLHCACLVRLVLHSLAPACVEVGRLPSLVDLELVNVDVRVRRLADGLPELKDAILTDARVLGPAVHELAGQIGGHPCLEVFDMVLHGATAGEQQEWLAAASEACRVEVADGAVYVMAGEA